MAELILGTENLSANSSAYRTSWYNGLIFDKKCKLIKIRVRKGLRNTQGELKHIETIFLRLAKKEVLIYNEDPTFAYKTNSNKIYQKDNVVYFKVPPGMEADSCVIDFCLCLSFINDTTETNHYTVTIEMDM